jgi:hypothetical protein
MTRCGFPFSLDEVDPLTHARATLSSRLYVKTDQEGLSILRVGATKDLLIFKADLPASTFHSSKLLMLTTIVNIARVLRRFAEAFEETFRVNKKVSLIFLYR